MKNTFLIFIAMTLSQSAFSQKIDGISAGYLYLKNGFTVSSNMGDFDKKTGIFVFPKNGTFKINFSITGNMNTKLFINDYPYELLGSIINQFPVKKGDTIRVLYNHDSSYFLTVFEINHPLLSEIYDRNIEVVKLAKSEIPISKNTYSLRSGIYKITDASCKFGDFLIPIVQPSELKKIGNDWFLNGETVMRCK